MLGTKIYKIKTREIVNEEGKKVTESYHYSHTQEFCDEYSALAEYCNNHGYVIEDKGGYYEAVTPPAPPEPTEKEKLEAELASLQAYLSSTDYMAIKCGERGLSMASEYPVEYAERQRARDRINEINVLLKYYA